MTLATGLAQAAAVQTVQIQMSGMKFMPMNVALKAGQPVTFQSSNTGVAAPELQASARPRVAPRGEAAWDAFMQKNTVWPGSSNLKLSIDGKAGVYEPACHDPAHFEAGMKGVLRVK